eukprot:scaffold272675_cov31-Tisochrysis_lutea.AAC.9
MSSLERGRGSAAPSLKSRHKSSANKLATILASSGDANVFPSCSTSIHCMPEPRESRGCARAASALGDRLIGDMDRDDVEGWGSKRPE